MGHGAGGQRSLGEEGQGTGGNWKGRGKVQEVIGGEGQGTGDNWEEGEAQIWNNQHLQVIASTDPLHIVE